MQKSKNGVLGGFGLAEPHILPWILQAIYEATPFLVGLLTSKAISNSTMIVQEVRSLLLARKLRQQGGDISSQRLYVSIPANQPDHPYIFLKKGEDAMTTALKRSGISQEESERIAIEVITVLLRDAPDAVMFMQKIVEKQ